MAFDSTPPYTKGDIDALIVRAIMHYKDMEETNPQSSMIREVKWQYAAMAAGGDGGEATYCGDPVETDENGDGVRWQSIRNYNYLGYPDRYFREVCDLLGWDR